MFRRWIIVGISLLTVCSLAGAPPAQAQPRGGQGEGLTATLEVVNPNPGPAEPVTLRFTLTNPTAETLQVLKWHTPLEGFKSDLLRVERDGRRVRYIGPLLKRGQPRPQDYVTLAAGQSVKAELDLAKGYDLSAPGHYTVQLDTQLLDARPGAQPPRDNRQLQARPLRSAPAAVDLAQGRGNPPPAAAAPAAPPVKPKSGKVQAKQANYQNCSDSQKPDLDDALNKAAQIAAGADLALAVTPDAKRSAAPRYKTWFGAYTTSRYSLVQTQFDKIQDALANQQITFDCDCSDGDSGTWAYVFPNQPYVIHLCPMFWASALEGTDSRSGTLVHESSHFYVVASTNDHQYGQSACKTLASTDPDSAIDNADSHEYFAENNPAQEMGIGPAGFGLLLLLTLLVAYRLRVRRRAV
ncbi:MAG TPA: M35 family metallo-endopeptidase [Thermoanaerobaculia bacterium]